MYKKNIWENEITSRAANNPKRMNSGISEICTTPQRRKNKKKLLIQKKAKKEMCAQNQSQKEKNKIGLQDYVDTK